MLDEVGGVTADAPEERRGSPVHEGQADEEQPRDGRDGSAPLHRPAVGSGQREVDPAMVRAESRGPDHGDGLDDLAVVEQRLPVLNAGDPGVRSLDAGCLEV